MTGNENLLLTVMEECAEISEDVSKSLRFGVGQKFNSAMTNGEKVMKEYYQLIAVVEMLQDNGVLPVFSEDFIATVKDKKKENVKLWQTVSKSLLCITGADEFSRSIHPIHFSCDAIVTEKCDETCPMYHQRPCYEYAEKHLPEVVLMSKDPNFKGRIVQY